MYRARDEVDNGEWLSALDEAAADLDLGDEVRSAARELFLSAVPEDDRSKRPALAASLYAASLVVGDQRAQTEVAEAVGVSRLSVQQRWKSLLREAGFDAPEW